ncbi:hypothetical protein KBD33_00475 [Candidatus Gracilibacteria bacterium]|nr:hypothetical protein [Candidatus Gracilibacteria bacterium]
MEYISTSYKGTRVDATLYEERKGILPDNTSESVVKFTQEAVSGFIFKREDGNTGFEGIFPKQKQ